MYVWYLLEESTSDWPATTSFKRKDQQVFLPSEDKLNFPHMLRTRKYAMEVKDARLQGWSVVLETLETCSYPANFIWGSHGQFKYAVRYLASEDSNSSPSILFEVIFDELNKILANNSELGADA